MITILLCYLPFQLGVWFGCVMIALTFDRTLRRQLLLGAPVELYSPEKYQREKLKAQEQKLKVPVPGQASSRPT